MTEVKTIPYEDIFAPKKVIDEPIEKLETKKSTPMPDFSAFFKRMDDEEAAAYASYKSSAHDTAKTKVDVGGPIADIVGSLEGERVKEKEEESSAFKSPFSTMTDEELEEALRKANKNTYWEFGLFTEKKRRAGKVDAFVYEKKGERLPVLPTYTDKKAREICGEPVAVSFGDLPKSTNVNSKGNPNSIRFSTHLEIHFDITEGASTKEGKSIAYMKAQSFLAAAYRGDTLGGKPVRRFRLTNMSEEELKAWGEVRAAFEGQGKKIEFILTDEQQKVFDRYAAKFAEITRLNRELVGGGDLDLSKSKAVESLKGLPKGTKEFYTRGEEIKPLEEPKPTPKMEYRPTHSKEVAKEAAPETVAKETSPKDDSTVVTTDFVSEEEKAAKLDKLVKAFEKGEYKPSSETTDLAKTESKAVEKTVDDKAFEEILDGFRNGEWFENDSFETISKMTKWMNDDKGLVDEVADMEEAATATGEAIPVGPVTEENEAATAEDNSLSEQGEFVNLPDVSAFFNEMDKIEDKAMKDAAKKFDLSTEKGRTKARDAVTALIVSDLGRAFNYAKKRNKIYLDKEILTADTIEEDLNKYYDRYGEKAEEIISNSEGVYTARDILREIKRRVGESRFANENAKKAYEKEKFNREMAIKTGSGYWRQNER